MIITRTKNLDAERCLLGCVMLNPGIMDRLLPVIRWDTFTAMSRKRIWVTIVNLYGAENEINIVSIKDWLGCNDFNRELLMCLNSVPTWEHWDLYSAMVIEKHGNRLAMEAT